MKKFRCLLFVAVALLCGGTATAQDDWSGHAVDDVVGATGDAGVVYLYNVGTGAWLSAGSAWGTEASVAPVGDPFTIKSSYGGYRICSTLEAEGEGEGCVALMTGTDDKGKFYLDRRQDGMSNNQKVSDCVTEFTSVGAGVVTYTLTIGGNAFIAQGLYLPIVSQDQAEEANAQWIIVTLEDMKENFKKVAQNASDANPTTASFVIDDRGFFRNNNDVSSWMTGQMNADGTSITWGGTLANDSKDCKPTDANVTVVTEYTYTYTGSHTYNLWGRQYTHDVTHTVTTTTPPDEQPTELTVACGGGGHISRDVTVTLDESRTTSKETVSEGYLYYVGNGYGAGKLTEDEEGNTYDGDGEYAQKLYGDKWTANIHGNGVIGQVLKTTTAGWYVVSCDGFDSNADAVLYAQVRNNNAVNGNAKADLKNVGDALPDTYAKAGALVRGSEYGVQVMVYVPESLVAGGNAAEIVIGVKVDNAQDGAWVCVDDFAMSYVGSGEKFIVLDEMQTGIDYINAQVDTDNSYPMVLKRTMTSGVWNSIMLPVSMTAQQFKLAFGNDSKLSKLVGVADDNYTIKFKSVDLGNDSETVLEAGKMYIMKPAKSANGLRDGSFDVSREEGVINKMDIAAPYFLVNQIVLDKTISAANGIVTESETTGFDGGTLTFNGTYINHTDKVIPGGSYLISNKGKWYHVTSDYAVKGFRAWIEAKNVSNDIKFDIDGVDGGDLTDIDGIENDLNVNTDNKVYNMNGQLVRNGSASLEGLPKGVYIVNGKKYIVK